MPSHKAESSSPQPAAPERRRAGDRRQLAFAAAAVLLAAADTYVVVAVLPSIMGGVNLGVDRLQRATPIITGFLLGYTVVLPLLGRLSDVVGRTPVFTACLVGFALGSLLTATAHALSVLVVGRALQGLGGGGLVPVTLSLVAERWPPESRGLPLGVVGAVQELGSVLGPLYGATIVALASWRTIFWVNLPLAGMLGAGFIATHSGRSAGPGRDVVEVREDRRSGQAEESRTYAGFFDRRGPGRLDVVGPVLLVAGGAVFALALAAPSALTNSVTVGSVYDPVVAGATWGRLTSPVAFAGAAVVVAGLAWEAVAPAGLRPVLPLRGLPGASRDIDLVGAVLLGGVLACVVVLFSTEDPSRQVVASAAPALIPAAAFGAVAFALHQRRSRHPLVEPRLLAPRAAWGALAVNLALGAGLMAALVDVPLFARTTVDPRSQLDAALELVRFLVAVPIGAVVGGVLCRQARRGRWVAAAGAAVSTGAFVAMAGWGAQALATPLRPGGVSLGFGATDVELVICGLGFGLAIAPVNAAMLAAVPARVHGLASSLVVVARTIGMLAGLSALTAIGLHRFYQAQTHIGSPFALCPADPGHCPAYDHATTSAVLTELHTIFGGAAVATGLGALLAAGLLRATIAGGAGTTTSSGPPPTTG